MHAARLVSQLEIRVQPRLMPAMARQLEALLAPACQAAGCRAVCLERLAGRADHWRLRVHWCSAGACQAYYASAFQEQFAALLRSGLVRELAFSLLPASASESAAGLGPSRRTGRRSSG